MALSGLHVVCSHYGPSPKAAASLIGPAVWSQTMASPATTTNAAPTNTQGILLVFRCIASADSYVSIGGAPDASSGTRYLLPASTTMDFYCQGGDKLAWTTA